MTIDILLTRPLPDAIDAELSARYAVHRLYAADPPDALPDRVASQLFRHRNLWAIYLGQFCITALTDCFIT